MLNKRWFISPALTASAEASLSAFPPIFRQLLYNRGYATEGEANAFLHAETMFDTSPWQMSGVSVAVERIHYALEHNQPIAIYGDYDVDGVTATALLIQALKLLGGNVRGYIPSRFEEGYGLNNEALDILKEQGIKLVISVDCGIRSPAETAHARAIGLDLIITDHHHPGNTLPEAFAIINPKQTGDQYPDKDLSGVGIAYKLAQALFNETESSPKNNQRGPSLLAPSGFLLESMLDLVALGTVADLAPLIGENRSLVRRGLTYIRQTPRQGLASLAAVADLAIARTTATHIGYILGPRLNAAGRLDSALAALDLLTSDEAARTGGLAQHLEAQNRERQALTRTTQEKAETIAISNDPQAMVLFAADPDFNPGVVGLAASRLVESYYRPAIVGHVGIETTRCSCRSIPEFHITEALDRCSELLIRHGGHTAAAGFTVENKKLPTLVERLKAIAKEQLGDKDLRPTLLADAEVPLTEMKPELLKFLEFLEPTGYGNPEAIFLSRNVTVRGSKAVGVEGKHLKLTLEDERGVVFDAIAFQMGRLQAHLPTHIDLMYSFETNEYNGRVSLQLNVKDIKWPGMLEANA